MPELEQVPGGQLGAAVVVVGDEIDGGEAGLPGARHDGRDLVPEGDDLLDRRRRQGPDQREPVHPEVRQRLDGVGLRASVGEQRAQAVLVQHGAQPVEERDVPGVGEIVDDDTDGAGVRRSARLRATGSGR